MFESCSNLLPVLVTASLSIDDRRASSSASGCPWEDSQEDCQHYSFTGVPQLRDIIEGEYHKLRCDPSRQQCVIFDHVTDEDVVQIDEAGLGKHIRLSHYSDRQLLIIRISPSLLHHSSSWSLALAVRDKVLEMGVPRSEFRACGAARYAGARLFKERDSSF